MPSETLFPYLTSTASAPSYREVVSAYRNVLATRYAEGTLRPLVIPYHLYGGFLLMAYFCIPHTKSPVVYATRWPVLAVIIWFEWKTMWDTSSQSPATALAAGLISAWGVVWSVTWLVLRRPQWDAKRVQRRKKRGEGYWTPLIGEGGIWRGRKAGKSTKAPRKHKMEKENAKKEESAVEISEGNGHLRDRALSNGHLKAEETNGHAYSNGNEKVAQQVSDSADNDEDSEYYWQSCPDNIWERIPWVMDLIMNFRGPGWNWAIPPLPDLPRHIRLKVGDTDSKTPSKGVSPVGLQQYTTRRELFHARLPEFIVGYFILDFVKVAMMKDPYYVFGPNTYALPPYLASLTPLQLRVYRETLSALADVVSLQMAFALMPLWLGLLHGPRVFGLRAEPWYFPSYWGSFSNITEKGLNGLWGGWWHQTFRLAFSAPSNYLIANGYVEARSMKAKVLALFFAFGISGFLHRWGSITQVPETHPWAPPAFFMLQAVGIFIQTTFTSTFRHQLSKLPKVVGQAGNLLFTFAWLVGTGWILVDDFSRGGVWLYEPIPISPLRGLGFGVQGDGWWCWEHIGVSWYTGKHWWESGIAL
jgi:hypothetical protein